MMSEENRALMLSGQGGAALRMWKDTYYAKTGVGSERCARPLNTHQCYPRNGDKAATWNEKRLYV
jgi:hypothetical protein